MGRPFRKNVGIIGLGIIGRRIADHLRHQGFSVFVWNRSPRAVPSFVGSPSELTQMCPYLQIFTGDDDALLQIIRAIGPNLTSRHVVIAHPTVSPYTMLEAAAIVERRGARLVEAPFSGSKLAAEKGELVYYVSGDEGAFQEVKPLLEASSKTILYVGELGHASILKVATNMVTAASVHAAAEAMALARNYGIALEKFTETLKQNASNSTTLDVKIPRMIAGDFETHFAVKHMLKDMQIANRLARNLDLDFTVTGATRDRLLDEARHGHGDDDFCAISRKYLPPIVKTSNEGQTDLFSAESPPEGQTSAHEDTAFVEQQLAEITATYKQENAAPASVPEAEAEITTKDEVVAPAGAPALTAEKPETVANNGDQPDGSRKRAVQAEPVERRGFFSRLLRRSTDY